MLGRRQFDLDQLGTEPLQVGVRGLVDRPHRRFGDVADRKLTHDPDADAAQVGAQAARRRLDRTIDARRVHRVVPGDRIVGQRNVIDGAAERPDLIEARRKRDQPVPRDAPVGRLETHHVTECSRLTDRSAGVAAERDRGLEAGDRGRAAGRRAAGNAIEIVRIARHAERRVLTRAAHRKLVEVGLPERKRARCEQPRDGRAGIRRNPVPEDLRCTRRPRAVEAHVVLDRRRDAGERELLPRRDPLVDAARIRARVSSWVMLNMHRDRLSTAATRDQRALRRLRSRRSRAAFQRSCARRLDRSISRPPR